MQMGVILGKFDIFSTEVCVDLVTLCANQCLNFSSENREFREFLHHFTNFDWNFGIQFCNLIKDFGLSAVSKIIKMYDDYFTK